MISSCYVVMDASLCRVGLQRGVEYIDDSSVIEISVTPSVSLVKCAEGHGSRLGGVRRGGCEGWLEEQLMCRVGL